MSARSVILNSNNWKEFNQNLVKLDNKEKGNAFELLTKYLFKVVPKYSNIYKEVWIHNELPQKLKKKFNYSDDIGIDLFAEHSSGEYHAIQCKYHSDKTKNVTRSELDGFLAVLQSRPSLTLGYICSSANGYSKNIEKSVSKEIQYILSDDWQTSIDEYMWAIHKYIKDKAFNIKPYDPRDHQKKAIKEAKKHFKKESRGKLIFPCGAGKSLTGFWFTQELKSKNTLIAVPSLSLIKQTLDVYLREIVANKKKVKWLCICSDDGIGKDDDIVFKTENIGVPCQTDPEYIENWLKENKNENKIIFTTYQSGKIISELSKKLKMSFDLGIFDEAHKTVGSSKKLFSHLLFEKNISIEKRIFMTATERFYGGKKSEDIISMDDEDIYGDTFSMMTFKEAINADLLTDYKVITIDIKKKEISDFIRENKLVELNGNWAKESESRALASMLALRKAMTLFPITNAVSFHSSIERAKRNLSLQDHITETYNYEPIDTFTVKGKDPTSLRSKIIREFAESKKALITNARCLTEGIDVPNIDCIIFTDPKRSKVDIVQALGRALRKKEGKDWGYVILPVIYNDKTNEIDNDNFDDILSVVRGLAANDERIVDYFKFKESERIEKSKAGERIFNFEVFSEYIDESELKENLQIKIWNKLSRFQWMPFEEAREIVRKYQFKNWNDYRKNKKRLPYDIPNSPEDVYKQKWINWGDWLGTFTISSHKRNFLSYEECQKFAIKNNIKSGSKWKKIAREYKLNPSLPVNIEKVYKSKWDGWAVFLNVRPKYREYLSFEDAKKIVLSKNLKNEREWVKFTRSKDFPINIPTKPARKYKNKGWNGIGDWLGTGRISNKYADYLDYKEANLVALKQNFKTVSEWNNFTKSNIFPKNLPRNPKKIYEGKGWKGYEKFLGIEIHINKSYLSYEEAEAFVNSLGLKNQKEWNNYYKLNKPKGIPGNPRGIYKNNGWEGIGKWLGTRKVSNANRNYLSFKNAKKIVQNEKLQSVKEWNYYSKNKRPNNIPGNPPKKYKKQWKGWDDFLGTGKKSPKNRMYVSFKEAKKYAKKNKINSQIEWSNIGKKGLRPENIPGSPQKKYKDQWKGWADFLGKEKK